MPVTEDDLVQAVTKLGGDRLVVSSREVKDWLDNQKIIWTRHGRYGGYLEKADHYAARNLRLTRWKQILGRRMVGWSLRRNIAHQGWNPAPL